MRTGEEVEVGGKGDKAEPAHMRLASGLGPQSAICRKYMFDFEEPGTCVSKKNLRGTFSQK